MTAEDAIREMRDVAERLEYRNHADLSADSAWLGDIASKLSLAIPIIEAELKALRGERSKLRDCLAWTALELEEVVRVTVSLPPNEAARLCLEIKKVLVP